MGTKQALTSHPRQRAVRSAVACIFAGALILTSALAAAQERAGSKQDESYLGNIGRWFDQQVNSMNATFKDVGQKLGKFGRDTGDLARTTVDGAKDAANTVARTTVDGAKDAAGAVARIPNARVIVGHEKCKEAPNGAPDCVAAANTRVQGEGLRIRQERRHDHRRSLPAASYGCRAAAGEGDAGPRPSSPARSANNLFDPVLSRPRRLCRLPRLCFRRAI